MCSGSSVRSALSPGWRALAFEASPFPSPIPQAIISSLEKILQSACFQFILELERYHEKFTKEKSWGQTARRLTASTYNVRSVHLLSGLCPGSVSVDQVWRDKETVPSFSHGFPDKILLFAKT